MKSLLYIAASALMASSCSTSKSLSTTIEDDIYFVPGKKALVVQEVENITGQNFSENPPTNRNIPTEGHSAYKGSSIPPANFSSSKNQTNVRENVNTSAYVNQQFQTISDSQDDSAYESTGYWVGGYKGNQGDLNEIQHIINQYPEGFGYIANGENIALNLSFDPDWNVYTANGRYWWFPSYTNIDLYSSLLFGTYPKYIWTVIWNNPSYDSWAFNSGWHLGLNIGWYNPGWNFHFGWYSPWYNNWYGSWYSPYWHRPYWHYPYWYYPHWNGGHWGGGHRPNKPQRPNSPVRPGVGNHISGTRPGSSFRPGVSGTRPSTTRPNTGSNVRPGNGFQHPGTMRPRPSGVQSGNNPVRPGGISAQPTLRPGNNTRPTTPVRPNTSRPGTTVRPTTPKPGTTGSYTRPGTTTRPGSTITRPTTRPAARPGTLSRPNSQNYSRPGNSNVKTYSRPQNTYRPTYNNNSSTRYSTGSRSNFNNRSATRSSGTVRPATVRNGGGPRR